MPDPRYEFFAARLRARSRTVGYWVTQDNPVATERISRVGYDYVVLDAQHGLLGASALLTGLMAVDAGGQAVGLVRVQANDFTVIGQALDAGAGGVIVPLIQNADDAAAAVAAAKYPPAGSRSFGPTRLRIGAGAADSEAATVVLGMIETAGALADVAAICATPGLDGVYVGTFDLSIALGGSSPDDPTIADEFETGLRTIRAAAESAGVAAGIHTRSGEEAARRLDEGYTFASIASDLVHLEQIASHHLSVASPGRKPAVRALGY